jgi:hypothetical protein
MPEKREQMHREQLVGTHQLLPEPTAVHGKEPELILLDDAADEMAVIVQHDSHDGQAPHGSTFLPCQYLVHFFN